MFRRGVFVFFADVAGFSAAPTQPRSNPYVYTFTGHWRMMNSVMGVMP